MRRWIFREKRRTYEGYVQAGDEELLMKVAATHASLILAGQTSEAILVAAKASTSQKDFETRLLNLSSDPQ